MNSLKLIFRLSKSLFSVSSSNLVECRCFKSSVMTQQAVTSGEVKKPLPSLLHGLTDRYDGIHVDLSHDVSNYSEEHFSVVLAGL